MALRVLFATDFSDACQRAEGLVAQLASAVPALEVSIVHVMRPGDRGPAGDALHRACAWLSSDRCERVLVTDDAPGPAVAGLSRRLAPDLIVAPAGRGSVPPGWFRPSIRGQLLEQGRAPLWPAGRCLDAWPFERPLRSVGCLIDFRVPPARLLRAAVPVADRLGARLVLLAHVPPVDDGTLLDVLETDRPLSAGAARARLEALPQSAAGPDRVEVLASRRDLAGLVARLGLEMLLVAPDLVASGWPARTGHRFPRALDALACPVVCLDVPGGGQPPVARRRVPRALTVARHAGSFVPPGLWPLPVTGI